MEDINEAWKNYFEQLLNKENNSDIPEAAVVEGPLEEVTEEEVRVALSGMKGNSAPGPSGLTSDLIKFAVEAIVKKLREVFCKIVDKAKCPEEWRNSTTETLFKGKGDALECGTYRGLRLLEHGMKIWEKILSERLKKKSSR